MQLLVGLSTLSLLYTSAFASPLALASDLGAVSVNPSDDARLNGGRGLPFSEPLTKRTSDESVAVNVDGSTGSTNVTIGRAEPPTAAANANATAAKKNASIYGPKAVALGLQAKRGTGRFSDGKGLIGLKEGDNMAGPMPPGIANFNQDGQGEIGLRPGEISAQDIASALGLLGGRDRDDDRDKDKNRDDRDDDRDRDRAGPPAPPPPPPGPAGDVDNRSGAQGVGSQPFAPFSMRYAAPPQSEQPPPQRDQREEEENQRQQQEQERQRQEEERQGQDREREEQERQRQQQQQQQQEERERQGRQEREQRQKYPAIAKAQPPPPPPQRAPAYAGGGGYSGPDEH
ncbi:uncharacterized protein IWZ02DRAFT_492102 [Phyllosticta citriasiana]|uniref:uncharacterized protein n=1 Tax=Phyllosticta citriasiana TaxID=595635 RepID=UPI0030FDC7CB